MDEKKFREDLSKRDRESLDDRMERWKQLSTASYDGVTLPNLAWYYVTEADEMYIGGHYIGVVLLCASTCELVLSRQVRPLIHITKVKAQRLQLEQLAAHGRNLGLIDEAESKQIDDLRQLRNELVHANDQKLGARGGNVSSEFGFDGSLSSGLFLLSVSEKGIKEAALKALLFTTDLTVKFHGTKKE